MIYVKDREIRTILKTVVEVGVNVPKIPAILKPTLERAVLNTIPSF